MPIPKSANPDRISSNCKIVQLDKEDLDTLDSLYEQYGVMRMVNPPNGVDIGFDSML